MPLSSASESAREVGAPTATMADTPDTTAFWTSSKPMRPLSTSTGGTCSLARMRAPTTLSTALCRPTSSRTTTGVPSTSKSPAACRPPVLPKPGWCSRSRSGRSSTVVRSRETGEDWPAAAMMFWTESVPHTPQAELTSRAVGSASGGVARSTVTTLNSSSSVSVVSVQYRTARIPPGVVKPSCTSQPAASSKSCPGVRMVTATRWAGRPGALTRISRGSSVATRSSWSRRLPSRHSATRVRTEGPGRRGFVDLTSLTLGAVQTTGGGSGLIRPAGWAPAGSG
jgi:hypothetical protein